RGRRPVRGRGELAGDVAGGDHPPAQAGRGRRIGNGGGREGERRLGTASGGVGVAHGSNLSVVPTPVAPMVDPPVMWNVEGAGSMPYRDLDTSGVLVHRRGRAHRSSRLNKGVLTWSTALPARSRPGARSSRPAAGRRRPLRWPPAGADPTRAAVAAARRPPRTSRSVARSPWPGARTPPA